MNCRNICSEERKRNERIKWDKERKKENKRRWNNRIGQDEEKGREGYDKIGKG